MTVAEVTWMLALGSAGALLAVGILLFLSASGSFGPRADRRARTLKPIDRAIPLTRHDR